MAAASGSSTCPLIDEVLPQFHFSDRRSAVIHASPSEIYQANMDLTVGEISSMKPLFWLRELPARVTGAELGDDPLVKEARFWEMAIGPQSPWRSLGERASEEAVMGAIGDFARPDIKFVEFTDSDEFVRYQDPTYLKTILGFRIIPGGNPTDGYTVLLESRTSAPDPAKRRRFALYWVFIKPFEGFMLSQALSAIKKRAESTGVEEHSSHRRSWRFGGIALSLVGFTIGAALVRRWLVAKG